MSFAAIGVSLAGAALTVGLSAALAPSPPGSPDLARSSRQAVLADVATLPGRRRVEALARLGEAGEYPTGRAEWHVPESGLSAGQLEWLRSQGLAPGDRVSQDQVVALGLHDIRPERRAGVRTADFTGIGDADIAGALARSSAETQLELSRKYGADFIDAALEQEALADPEGTAARRLLAAEIKRMAETERERPVSGELSGQMLEDIQAGRALTPDVAGQVGAVGRRRGDTTVDLETELEEGVTAEERLRQRLQHGTSWLGSGQTPEDQRFRDEQQAMANMAAYLQGRTPQSQFGSNRNAQQGAAPVAQGPALPGGAADAGTFAGANLHNFNAQVAQLRGNVSPWFAGLAALTGGAQVAAGAGFQPFQRQA